MQHQIFLLRGPIGQRDLVRCYQCNIGLKDFSEDDDPMMEHVRHSGNCPYPQQHLGDTKLAALERQIQPEDRENKQQMQLNGCCRHPEYKTLQSRLESFAAWPKHMTQTPQQLAEAGLYYTGLGDQVRCYDCDGGLRSWDPEDNPWTEHCRFFPACPFAIEQMGEEFITLVQASDISEYRVNQSEQSTDNIISSLCRLKERRGTCLEMGFPLTDFNEAVQELRKEGQGELVRCLNLKDFSAGEDPSKEHMRHSGKYPYLQHLLGYILLEDLNRQMQTENPEYNQEMQRND